MEQKSGCEGCTRTWEEDMYWRHFSSIHFYRFLPKDFHHHLVLPAKFSQNMMAVLPDKVCLIGPGATVWDIELKKTDNIEFGGDGWKEFVKSYDLKENNLLMFTYKQNSGFEVLIFDPESSCEREASYFVKQCRHGSDELDNGKRRRITGSFSVEVVEDEAIHASHTDPGLVVSKKSRNRAAKEPERRMRPRTPRNDALAHPSRGNSRPRRALASSNSRSKLGAQTEKELEENEAPLDVVEKEPEEYGAIREIIHLLETEHTTLENEENSLGTEKEPEESGLVHDVVEEELEENGEANEQSTLGSRGGIQEIADSPKSTGKKSTPKKRVAVISPNKRARRTDSAEKYSKEYKSNRRPVTETEKKNALDNALQRLTNEQSFVSVMRPTAVYKRFYLNFPMGWMKEHILLQNQQVVLRVGDRTWVTMFYYYGSKGGGLTGVGWKKFVLDNMLEEFDACLFKLATKKDDPETVIDVDIFRVIPESVPLSPVG